MAGLQMTMENPVSAQPATPTTVASYLTAVQDAIRAGDLPTAERQLILAELELAKLPVMDTGEDSTTTYRQTFSSLRNALATMKADTKRRSGSRVARVSFV